MDMNLLEGLNEPQREAVTHGDGPLLIFAGAGSGKTRTLTHRIAHLISERNVPPARILAVTFTNKAAKEMRERLENLVGAGASRIWMGTFHAMCAQMLRINGGLVGIDPRFVIFDSDDSQRLMRDILKQADVDSDRFPPSRILNRISDAKNNLRTPAELEDNANTPNDRVVARLYRNYQQRLKAAHALDFDDLLGEAVRLLRESDEAREYWSERFLHVLIDEFQDVNAAQFKWAQLLAGKHRNICVVGDDDQCLAPGTLVNTPSGAVAIKNIEAGDSVLAAPDVAPPPPAAVTSVKSRHYEARCWSIRTRGGHVLRATPNHMCFARLGVRPDVHMYISCIAAIGLPRIGIAVVARSDGRRDFLIIGLQVRANQRRRQDVGAARVRHTQRSHLLRTTLCVRFRHSTTVFHVAGRSMVQWTQEQIDDCMRA
jgi:DNA helicase-2/ATP-dependent DNA helicase PcrA